MQNKLTTAKKVTPQAIKECNLPLSTANSVFLTNVTNYQPFYPQTINRTCNQQIFLLEPDLDHIYPLYLYYYLLSHRANLLSMSSPNQFFNSLRKTELISFILAIPSLTEQQKNIEELTLEMKLLQNQKELISLFTQKEQGILRKN
ncbi:MAG: restriction endonuclease subunit S [Mollicutes bacterium UO1]